MNWREFWNFRISGIFIINIKIAFSDMILDLCTLYTSQDYPNPFHAAGLFLYPLKTSESQRIFISGGIERGQWHEMG